MGYAYATQWKARAAYDFAREVTVYLKPGFENLGYGTKLYRALISILQDSPIHSLIAGIAQPNAASVALHEKLGFKKVGEFEEVGLKFGRRVNIGYWQLLTMKSEYKTASQSGVVVYFSVFKLIAALTFSSRLIHV